MSGAPDEDDHSQRAPVTARAPSISQATRSPDSMLERQYQHEYDIDIDQYDLNDYHAHMLREAPSRSNGNGAGDWASNPGSAQRPSWQTIDRALRTIARRRAGLDADEARWLREADRCQLWRELGMVSALDYMERVLGYAPRTATERLRVAHALDELPVLTNALACGQFPYCAIRELTRIATPETERAWCDSATGKNVHQIAAMVRGRRRGHRPEDPVDPTVETHAVRLELSAEAFALFRQAHQALDEEAGRRLSDDELMIALCNAILERGAIDEPSGRAKFQIALTVCKRCQQGWQEGAGVQVAVDASTVERAYCDAQELGSIDGAEPERAHQDVPPSVMRLVWRRDGSRCRVPGCRSSRNLEAHHLVHREHGGSHDASNLILLCSSCHAAHHRGKLKISGTASELNVERCAESRSHVDSSRLALVGAAEPRAHVGPSRVAVVQSAVPRAHVDPSPVAVVQSAEPRAHVGPSPVAVVQSAEPRAHVGPKSSALAASVTCAQAKEALVGLGWKRKIAAEAVRSAASALGDDAALEKLIFEALKRCPRPTR